METQNKNKFEIIARPTLILSFLGMFITVALGISLHTIHHENNHLSTFVAKSATLQSDFEQSLKIYTENIESTMKFVDTLRPDTDNEYINFIGVVESLGHNMGLNIELESQDSTAETLSFSASFYGTKEKLIEFLSGLEAMPYYIRIETLSYRDLSLQSASDKEDSMSNIQLTFVLYVK